jgi:hypothetical protein
MGGTLPRSVFATALFYCGLICLCGCDKGYPPGCHHDCGGYAECRDGEVTVWWHMPVPCDEWSGQCPHNTFTCEKGCNTDPEYVVYEDGVYYSYWPGYESQSEYMCEEHRPKLPGDQCAVDTDCEPPDYYQDENGHSIRYELTCDTDAGECVEVTGP